MKSMPATSSPTIWAAVSAISTLSGWASIVRSIDVPPVDMLPVRASLTQVPSGGTSSSSKPWARTSSSAASSTLIRVRTFSWPMPRRGSAVGDVDELADGVLAVAGDARRHALGDRRDLAADDEAAVVVAGDVASRRRRRRERLCASAPWNAARTASSRAQVEVDAAAVVAVERLDDAREADPLRGGDGLVLGVDDVARAGRAGRPSRAAGWSGSCRDAMSTPIADVLRGHRRPDPLLVDALAELDERVAVEADERDVAADRLVDERLGRRARTPGARRAGSAARARREVEEDRRGRPARRGG